MKTIENEDYKAEEKCRIFIWMEKQENHSQNAVSLRL
jgi:hypothetical protein